MKIICWNVNGIRACYKKGLSEFLEKENPDIFCIQETKGTVDQVDDSVKKLGRNHAYWASAARKGYSGVATFLNKEPRQVTLGIGKEEYDTEGRVLVTDHDDFLLYNIYFPNGGSGVERHLFKQKFLSFLNDHLKEKINQGREIIVVGDYNIAHQEIDIYDPIKLAKESGFLPEERTWFNSFLDLGFIDTFRYFHPNETQRYSWWSYRELARIFNRGWRIDYICVTKGLKNRLISADILDQVHGSDHCPIVVQLL